MLSRLLETAELRFLAFIGLFLTATVRENNTSSQDHLQATSYSALLNMPPTRMYALYLLIVAFIALHTLSTGCPFHIPPPEPMAPSVCHTRCPSGWHNFFENHCFIMVGERLPWAQAEVRCQELVTEACGQGVTGHLASINGAAESSFVHGLWRRMGRGDLAIDTLYWIGLTKQTGQLQWTDRSLPLYTNWDTGVEESLDSIDGVCAYVSGSRGSQRRWNAGDCEQPMGRVNGLPFVCKLARNPDLSQPSAIAEPA